MPLPRFITFLGLRVRRKDRAGVGVELGVGVGVGLGLELGIGLGSGSTAYRHGGTTIRSQCILSLSFGRE